MEGVSFVVATLLGTFKRPKLTNITTGKFTGESLVFHTQEGEKYVEDDGEMVPTGRYHEYHRNSKNNLKKTLPSWTKRTNWSSPKMI